DAGGDGVLLLETQDGAGELVVGDFGVGVVAGGALAAIKLAVGDEKNDIGFEGKRGFEGGFVAVVALAGLGGGISAEIGGDPFANGLFVGGGGGGEEVFENADALAELDNSEEGI